MAFFNILSEPAIIIISAFFLCFLLAVIASYTYVFTNLKKLSSFLKDIEKKELSYRFKQLDEFMISNDYYSTIWEDFKKALIFPEKLYVSSMGVNTQSSAPNDIFLTVDASYFFNEETLISSKINYKFIQIMPTLLTGLGPFFTFLKMALAFQTISFSEDANIGNSLNGLMENIQIAALCSVFAVGFSLIFMFIEKILYNNMCKKYCLSIQKEFVRLFEIVTSEQFLIDLLKESKIQNISNEKLLKSFPENFTEAVTKSINDTAIPYLENILYSLNKLNETFNKGNGGDIVDKLF